MIFVITENNSYISQENLVAVDYYANDELMNMIINNKDVQMKLLNGNDSVTVARCGKEKAGVFITKDIVNVSDVLSKYDLGKEYGFYARL